MVRYIGGRYKAVDSIWRTIFKFFHMLHIEAEEYTLFDICSGTGILSECRSLSFGKIFANDTSYYAYVLSSMRLEFQRDFGCQKVYNYINRINQNTVVPYQERFACISDFLNSIPEVDGFIAQHYTTEWTEKTHFYSIENGRRIDAIRQEIGKWINLGLLSQIESNYLIGSLLECADSIANVKYRYDSAVKPWHEERMIYVPYNYQYNKNKINPQNRVTQFDCENTILKTGKKSVVLFDPPFQRHDYTYQYGLPITIAKYDNPQVRGLYNLRQQEPASNFCRKNKYLTAVASTYRNAFESNDARFFFMLVPKYDNKATFDNDELLKFFQSKNVKRFEREEIVMDERGQYDTPWRDSRDKTKILYIYCVEK